MPGNHIFRRRFHAAAGFRLAAILAAATAVSSLLVAIARPPSGQASTESPQHQSVAAEVSSEVSWGSANGCQQNIQTNDFGQLTPGSSSENLGAFAALPSASASLAPSGARVWVGCVTSNAPLASVVAQGIHNMKDPAGSVLPASDVAIGVTNQAPGPTSATCTVVPDQSAPGRCTLPVDDSTVRTLIGEAPAGTTELNWQYQLNLPANQPVGTYTDGQVVFTATAADAPSSPPSPPGEPPTLAGCEVTWTGAAGDGTWSDGRNWSTGATPTGTQHVCILHGATVTSSGEWDQAGSLTDTGELIITSTLTINGPSASSVNDLVLNRGTLTGAGNVHVTASLLAGNISNMTGSGETIIATGATGTILDGSDYGVNLNERTLANTGTLTVEKGSGIQAFNHARLLNSGTLVINSEGQDENHLLLSSQGQATLINTGTLEKAEGDGTTIVDFDIDNGGTVDVQHGQLEFANAGNSDQSSTSHWSTSSSAQLALNCFSAQATYELGASPVLQGNIFSDCKVTAGSIEGKNANLTFAFGQLTMTGTTPSTLNTLTLTQPAPGVGDEQDIHVASELDIQGTLNWSSDTADFLGPGTLLLGPRSSNVFSGTAAARLQGGQVVNEGIVTWQSGGIAAEGNSGVFFVNLGEFRADQNGSDPIFGGCREIVELGFVTGYHCPVFQNYGTFTGVFPAAEDLPQVQHTWIEWDVTLENFGQLQVGYEQDPNCYWGGPEPTLKYFECQAAINVYKGLVLNRGAQVIDRQSCSRSIGGQDIPEPCVDDEPPEAEEAAVERGPVSEVGSPIAEKEACKRSESETDHCYGLVESPWVKPPTGFRGSSVEIDPVCLATNGDRSNFADAEQWVNFPESESIQDWTEAGVSIGTGQEPNGTGGHFYSYPEYFTADVRSILGHSTYHQHDSGVAVPLNDFFRDTIWQLGGDEWEAWLPGFHLISSPQPELAKKLEAGTENTANDVSAEAALRNLEYETSAGKWRTGWAAEGRAMAPFATTNSTATATILSPTTAEVSFNSRSC